MRERKNMSDESNSGDVNEEDLLLVPNNCAESVKNFSKYVWESISHHELPNWLKDNEFIEHGHRPELPSITACLKSWFRLHTETGNIWTHLFGALMFIFIAISTFSIPTKEKPLQEKFIFGIFFFGAITCLFCSTFYHTFSCYSSKVSVVFKKIDYCGISILTMGSFVPWLYYAFYCQQTTMFVYIIFILFLGSSCIIVSLWEKFGTSEYRALRAGMFIALGLSAIIPATHFTVTIGAYKAWNVGNMKWLILMAVLYIGGACIYAARIPERYFPGKCDIWFQSHQIFHVCVVVAAYVHYHGISNLSKYSLSIGDCLTAHLDADFTFEY